MSCHCKDLCNLRATRCRNGTVINNNQSLSSIRISHGINIRFRNCRSLHKFAYYALGMQFFLQSFINLLKTYISMVFILKKARTVNLQLYKKNIRVGTGLYILLAFSNVLISNEVFPCKNISVYLQRYKNHRNLHFV